MSSTSGEKWHSWAWEPVWLVESKSSDLHEMFLNSDTEYMYCTQYVSLFLKAKKSLLLNSLPAYTPPVPYLGQGFKQFYYWQWMYKIEVGR